jgi:uncharacterized RDD family membrane protein YckC
MTSRSYEGEYAGFVSRLAALAIDILLMTITTVTVTGISSLILAFFINQPTQFGEQILHIQDELVMLGTALAFLFPPVYFIAFWTLFGQTIGKAIMGLRIVRRDGGRVSVFQAATRWMLFTILVPGTLFVGAFWVLLDNRRRAFHDMLSGTVVVYSGTFRLHDDLNVPKIKPNHLTRREDLPRLR